MRKMIRMTTGILFIMMTGFCQAQNVGINTSTPNHSFTVVSSGDGIVSKNGTVEVGTYVNSSSAYLQTYSNTPLYFSTNNGSTQLSLLTNGNFGVGVQSPNYKLDVSGTTHITGDITAGSDIDVAGDITVQSGKGIIRAVNSTQLKYYSRDAGFAITLGAFGSFDATIGFTTGLFNTPPRVIVGDVTDIISGLADFHKLKLIVFNVGVNNCQVRLYNDSNASISVNASWSIICIGN